MTTPVSTTPATFQAIAQPDYGVIRLVGQNIPNGLVTITRTDANGTVLVRGAINYPVNTGAFVIDDPEAPFDMLSTYHLSVLVDDPLIGQNLLRNPSGEVNTVHWNPVGTGRTVTRNAATPTAPAAVGGYLFTMSPPSGTPAGPDVIVQTDAQQMVPNNYLAYGMVRVRPGQGTDVPGYVNYAVDPDLRTQATWTKVGTAAESTVTWISGGGVTLTNLRPYAGQNWGATKTQYADWTDVLARETDWQDLMNTGQGVTPPDQVLLGPSLAGGAGGALTVALRGDLNPVMVVNLINAANSAVLETQVVTSTDLVQLVQLTWPAGVPNVRVSIAPARGQQPLTIRQIGFYYGTIPASELPNVPTSGRTPGHFWMGAVDNSTSAVYQEVCGQAQIVLLDAGGVVFASADTFPVCETFTPIRMAAVRLAATTMVRVGIRVDQATAKRTWDFDAMRLDIERPNYPYSLEYFDGTTPLPAGAPAGSVIRWTGTAHDSVSEYMGAATVEMDSDTVVLTIPLPAHGCAGSQIHLSDPVAPLYGGYYTLTDFSELSFTARNTDYDVIGRAAPLTVSDVRTSPDGDVSLLTFTLAERDALRMLVASGRTLVLRMPPEWGDPVLYVVVGDVTETRILPDIRRPERAWILPVQVADRPGGLVDTGVSNWQAVVDNNATWATVKAAYDSWTELILGSLGSSTAMGGSQQSGTPPVVITGWQGVTARPGGAWYGSGYRGIPQLASVRNRDRAVGQ